MVSSLISSLVQKEFESKDFYGTLFVDNELFIELKKSIPYYDQNSDIIGLRLHGQAIKIEAFHEAEGKLFQSKDDEETLHNFSWKYK